MTHPPITPAGPDEIDTSNAAQAAAWDGPEGRYWAAHPARFDRSLAAYQGRFMGAARIAQDSMVLDVGCGTGETTREAARLAPSGAAVGIDLSGDMIDVARSIAASDGLTNVSFVRGDAQVHRLPARRFDRVVSRTGLMFFGEPTKALTNIAGSMQPGGQLTALTWQPPERNEWIGAFATALLGKRPTPTPGTPGPFSMSDPEVVRTLLHTTGFADIEMVGLSEPMYYGDEVDDAQRFVAGLLGWMLDGRDENARRTANEALTATLEAHLTTDGVAFESAAWLITARRT